MEKVNTPNTFWARWSPAIMMMIAIFLFSSIPSSGMPYFGAFDLAIKKLGHMMGYALLALAYYHGLRGHYKYPSVMAWMLAVAYAITDELHQGLIPGRSPWIIDIGIDAFGALVGLLVAPNLYRLFPKL